MRFQLTLESYDHKNTNWEPWISVSSPYPTTKRYLPYYSAYYSNNFTFDTHEYSEVQKTLRFWLQPVPNNTTFWYYVFLCESHYKQEQSSDTEFNIRKEKKSELSTFEIQLLCRLKFLQRFDVKYCHRLHTENENLQCTSKSRKDSNTRRCYLPKVGIKYWFQTAVTERQEQKKNWRRCRNMRNVGLILLQKSSGAASAFVMWRNQTYSVTLFENK